MVLFRKLPMPNIISREYVNEKGLFLKRVGSLLEEGYSLKDALLFLGKIENGETKKWIQMIQEGLLKGYTFHHQLEELGFSSKICAQIYLGLQTGTYGHTIAQCGEQLLNGVERQKKFKALTTYPTILVLFLLGMLLLMRLLILPHMENLFASTGSTENMYSNGLVWMVYYSPQVILGSLLALLTGFMLLKKGLSHLTVLEKANWFSRLPFLKRYLKDYYTHFFFLEWGNLFQNGRSFQEIVTIMQGEQASPLLRETGEVLAAQMKQGKTLNESLEQFAFIHQEGQEIVLHGESLGKLSTEMLVYAQFCENELNQRVERLMEKMQPMIFIFVALMIISIYGALMLPIFTLMEGF